MDERVTWPGRSTPCDETCIGPLCVHTSKTVIIVGTNARQAKKEPNMAVTGCEPTKMQQHAAMHATSRHARLLVHANLRDSDLLRVLCLCMPSDQTNTTMRTRNRPRESKNRCIRETFWEAQNERTARSNHKNGLPRINHTVQIADCYLVRLQLLRPRPRLLLHAANNKGTRADFERGMSMRKRCHVASQRGE